MGYELHSFAFIRVIKIPTAIPMQDTSNSQFIAHKFSPTVPISFVSSSALSIASFGVAPDHRGSFSNVFIPVLLRQTHPSPYLAMPKCCGRQSSLYTHSLITLLRLQSLPIQFLRQVLRIYRFNTPCIRPDKLTT